MVLSHLFFNTFFQIFQMDHTDIIEKILMKSKQSIDFMEEKKKVFQKALLSCLPSVIRMGLRANTSQPPIPCSFFSKRMAGLPGCLPSIYSCYRYFTYEVCHHDHDYQSQKRNMHCFFMARPITALANLRIKKQQRINPFSYLLVLFC